VSTHNRKILDALLRASKEQHLHHAYILSGPASVAKMHCVEQFAAEIFSEKNSGGSLFTTTAPEAGPIAERIQRRAHPDFTHLEEPAEGEKNGKTILEQIRDLPKLLAYPPLEAALRVVLIPHAAELNDSAFNSILKILEEPPAHTMFFLFCRDLSELLPTIVSRCQVLRFAPLADAEMRSYLSAHCVTEEILGFAEGALERAELLLIPESGNAELRSQACEQLLALWESSPRIPSSAQQWVEKIEGDAAAKVVVDSWEVLFRDLAFLASGATATELRFQGLHARLAPLAARADGAEIPQRFSALNRFRVYRSLNGNLRLDFAALLSELQIFSVGKAAAASLN
jgi:DNA polymerase-3 subunit delta'